MFSRQDDRGDLRSVAPFRYECHCKSLCHHSYAIFRGWWAFLQIRRFSVLKKSSSMFLEFCLKNILMSFFLKIRQPTLLPFRSFSFQLSFGHLRILPYRHCCSWSNLFQRGRLMNNHISILKFVPVYLSYQLYLGSYLQIKRPTYPLSVI